MQDGRPNIYTGWLFRLLLLGLLAYPVWELLAAGRWPALFGILATVVLVLAAQQYSRRLRRRLNRAGRELDDRATELQTLHAIGREIVCSVRPERVFATLERESRKIFEFDCCLIALVDHASGTLNAAYRNRRRRSTEIGSDLPVQDLARWALTEKRGTRVDDLERLPRDSTLRGPWLAPATRSFLVAPLLVDGEVIGVLSLQSEQPRTYDDHQLSLLTTIAQQAAIAIESARRHELARVDSLTGLYVRDYFFSRLEEEDERARRYGGGFALLMVDLDDFKEINDRHGHLAGDQYLREIAGTVREQLRAADIACRYGGDEFCLLLPQTGAQGARAIAERIRSAVAGRVVSVEGLALRTTVSIGLSVFPENDDGDLRGLMRMADEALYRAKRAGRDRVVPFAA